MKIKKYTRVTAFFLAVCTVLLMLPLSVRADEYWPDGVKTQSKSAIVMEVNTGTVLYEKKSHEKHYPASITKIMTVLLAIENCDMDEVVTFSADAVFKNEGRSFYGDCDTDIPPCIYWSSEVYSLDCLQSSGTSRFCMPLRKSVPYHTR